MDTLVRDPFFEDVPALFGLSLEELFAQAPDAVARLRERGGERGGAPAGLLRRRPGVGLSVAPADAGGGVRVAARGAGGAGADAGGAGPEPTRALELPRVVPQHRGQAAAVGAPGMELRELRDGHAQARRRGVRE